MGAEFEFAPGTREAFLNLVDPSTAFGKIGLNSFGTHAARRMLPDDPGSGKADRWRLLASAVSSGISYREPGLKPSLHIAIRKDSADVHVDREGFINLIGGRVVYDPKQTINHLTADLASDYIPGLVSSLTVKDDNGRTKFQGTFAPWLEVNLPGTKDISGNRSTQTERIYGLRRNAYPVGC